MEAYLILKVVWWLLLGVLLMGLAVMVGMDMGVGTILRYVGRTDAERRVALNIIGPHWDGNQVWFILGGGAIFAAWPLVYATAFSGFYVVMLVLLWSMIVRPLGFEYRSKLPSARWRNAWDWALFVSGFVPMLVFGAAIGNILTGVPFHFSWNLTSTYTGSFIELFNPFAILCGAAVGGDVGIHGRRNDHERCRGSDAQASAAARRLEWACRAGSVHCRRNLGEHDVRLSARTCTGSGACANAVAADGGARRPGCGWGISAVTRSWRSCRSPPMSPLRSVSGPCAGAGLFLPGGWARSVGSASSARWARPCFRSCCRQAPSLRTA